MSKPSHSHMDPGPGAGPVGWATVRITAWQAGQRAESLAAFFMLAAETEAACVRKILLMDEGGGGGLTVAP